jgi:hypothetical protein
MPIKILQRLDPRRLLARPSPKEPTVQSNQPFVYTEDQLMARLKFFIGVCLALTLTGIVFVVLYSLIFVTQPLNAISPIDQKFFELIVPIATFLTGTLSGIMLAGRSKEDQEAMLAAHKQAADNQESAAKAAAASAPKATAPSFGGSGGFGSAPLGGNTMSTAFAAPPSWGTTPIPAAPSMGGGDVTQGWGGKAAPPPVTEWPER